MTVEVVNFGCRLNSYEGEVIKKQALTAGLKNTIILNSCSVTSEAERQLGQTIRKVRKQNPNAKIIVTGCAAQINPTKYANMKEVDSVIGNLEKVEIDSYKQIADQNSSQSIFSKKNIDQNNIKQHDQNDLVATDSLINTSTSVIVSDILEAKELAQHLISGFENRSRAFIQVQNGCNHRCTFCIIPYGRGNSRSIPIGEIVKQAKILVENGYKELVITGVDITDYGLDLPGQPRLGQMLKRLIKIVPQIDRIRLSSLDVAEIDKDLLDLIEHEHRVMPHLHLSLQSGDNMILKRMKRRHSSKQVKDFCESIYKIRSTVAFGADVIVGFPTETDEMYKNTKKLIDDLEICHLHIFPYSERDGTPAARMPQVDHRIRKERAKDLKEVGLHILQKRHKKMINKKFNILVEDGNCGRAEDYCLIHLSELSLLNSLAHEENSFKFLKEFSLKTTDHQSKQVSQGSIVNCLVHSVNNGSVWASVIN